jgi:hypothetical protein
MAVAGNPDAARELLAHTAEFGSPESAQRLDPLIADLWAHRDAAGAAKWAAGLKPVDVRAEALIGVVAAAVEELDPAIREPRDANSVRPGNPLIR